jgi:4-amino-4-deoxychorismate lyase
MKWMKNGELNHTGQDIAVDVQDRAFLYGDGFFTTIKIVHGQPMLWHRHLHRLTQCAAQLYFQVDLSNLPQQIVRLLAASRARGQFIDELNGVLKVIVSRGVGERGYVIPDTPADIYIQFFEQKQIIEAKREINSGVLDITLGHLMPQLAGLKTLNRLEQVILKQALAQTDWAEGLVCDHYGNVIEGVSSNCFFYSDQTWITPNLDHAGVAGTMRAEILHQMQTLNIHHKIAPMPKEALSQVEALFFCNALTGIVAVKALNDRVLNTEIVQQLQQQLLLS